MTYYAESVGIMWPVLDLPDVEEAHVTILYLGETSEQHPSVTGASIAAAISGITFDERGYVSTTGLEVFGRDNKVYVATLNQRLEEEKDLIEAALMAQLPVANASSFPEYRPHVTLGPVVEGQEAPELPSRVYLGKPEVWWGQTHYLLG